MRWNGSPGRSGGLLLMSESDGWFWRLFAIAMAKIASRSSIALAGSATWTSGQGLRRRHRPPMPWPCRSAAVLRRLAIRQPGRRASVKEPVPGSGLGLAGPRCLHGAQMRCPEEAGETAEERHSCEHRADEPADKLSSGTRARDAGEPGGNERLKASEADSPQRLGDRGDGQTGCGSDGQPACGDPRASGHAYMTRAAAVRCRGDYAASSAAG